MVPRHGKELNSFRLFATVKMPILINRKDVVYWEFYHRFIEMRLF